MIGEMIAGSLTENGSAVEQKTNLMTFLQASAPNEKSDRTRKGDFFFVKNHHQDGVVYYLRDSKLEDLMILADPVEAIDRFCEHTLLKKEDRFDFRPWAIPFTSPDIPNPYRFVGS